MYVEQEGDFFSDHEMNYKAAEAFHSLCVCSSICDLEDYWSQLGTATVLAPRGSDNKTQMLRKVIVRRHQNISPHASILPALKRFYLPESGRSPPGEKCHHQEQNRGGITVFPPNLLLLVSLLSTIFYPAAQARNW